MYMYLRYLEAFEINNYFENKNKPFALYTKLYFIKIKLKNKLF